MELDEEDKQFTASVREAVGFAVTDYSNEGINWGILFEPPGFLEVIDQWIYEPSGGTASGMGSSGQVVFVCEGKKAGQTNVIVRLYREDGFPLDEREILVNVRGW